MPPPFLLLRLTRSTPKSVPALAYPALHRSGSLLLSSTRVRTSMNILQSQLSETNMFIVTPNLSGKPEKRDKLFDPYCGGGNDATANVNDVIACFNYLQSIGGISCGIAGDGNQHHMCEAGTAIIAGVSVFGTFTETAW